MKLPVVASLVLSALTAASPSILPPLGWKAKDVADASKGSHIVGAWLAPAPRDGYVDNITLTVEPTDLGYESYVKVSRALRLRELTKEFKIDADEPCGNGKAHRLEYVATFGTTAVDIVQLMRVSGGSAYVATYTRLPKEPAEAGALAALHTLCEGTP